LLDLFGHVRHGGCVVLVGKGRKMMAELVDEDVGSKLVVSRHRAVKVVDAAAAVRAPVHDDLDDIVRGERGHSTELLVVEGEHVALRAKRVIRGSDRRVAMNAERRPRDAGLTRGRCEAPDVEVGTALLEW